MANPIVVNKDLPTDDADVLGGSALDPIPNPGGLLMVYIASSQRDGQLTVGGPTVEGGGTYLCPPVLRSNGIPDLQADMPYLIRVQPGRVNINYNEVTAGDAFATIIFVPD